MSKAGEIDLNLKISDVGSEQQTLDAEIATKIAGIELDVDAELDRDGKPTVTIGIKIPIP
jgi:hypothetical protein